MTDRSGRRGDPGVPEAVSRALGALLGRVEPTRVDRVWVFPPLVSGRNERGLVAMSRLEDGTDDRRALWTASYSAALSGAGLEFDVDVREEGEASAEHLMRVISGVVRRSGDDLGDPRKFAVDGDPSALERLVDEVGTPAETEDGAAAV